MAITPQQAQITFNKNKAANVQMELAKAIEKSIDEGLAKSPEQFIYIYNIRTSCNKETFEYVVALYQKAGWIAANNINMITISKKPECDREAPKHLRGHCSCRDINEGNRG